MDRSYTFLGGRAGPWKIDSIIPVCGDTLAPAERLAIHNGNHDAEPSSVSWRLRGVVSNERYVTRPEKSALLNVSPPLGRAEATRAALIPIKKSTAWWSLAQDERREILEENSRHIATGMRYLPAVARRLHHGRDLGEPFDFVTWFEFAPTHNVAFEQLVAELRRSEEWKYVEREVDVRLVREP